MFSGESTGYQDFDQIGSRPDVLPHGKPHVLYAVNPRAHSMTVRRRERFAAHQEPRPVQTPILYGAFASHVNKVSTLAAQAHRGNPGLEIAS